MLMSSGQITPIITNINTQQSRLQGLHEKMGFGAVPKSISKREGGTVPQKSKRHSKSRSAGRSAPQVNRVA